MQLNRTTDYVVRIVYFLSNENRIFETLRKIFLGG